MISSYTKRRICDDILDDTHKQGNCPVTGTDRGLDTIWLSTSQRFPEAKFISRRNTKKMV